MKKFFNKKTVRSALSFAAVTARLVLTGLIVLAVGAAVLTFYAAKGAFSGLREGSGVLRNKLFNANGRVIDIEPSANQSAGAAA